MLLAWAMWQMAFREKAAAAAAKIRVPCAKARERYFPNGDSTCETPTNGKEWLVCSCGCLRLHFGNWQPRFLWKHKSDCMITKKLFPSFFSTSSYCERFFRFAEITSSPRVRPTRTQKGLGNGHNVSSNVYVAPYIYDRVSKP